MESNFAYVFPTKVYFGKGEKLKIGNILKERNASRVLIVYGMGHAKKTGLIDLIVNLIKKEDIECIEFGGARPNPTIDFVRDGINVVKKSNVDFILGVGGGSALDSAKLISIGALYDGDPFDFVSHKVSPNKRLPLGTILTIAGSGSETSNSCVIQDDTKKYKSGFASDINRPDFSILDPELTLSVNEKETANGTVDMLTHTMERYFSSSSINEPCDLIAESVIKGIIECGNDILTHLDDLELRSKLLLYSSISHSGITSIGKKYIMMVHQLEHALSGVYPFVSHARGLSVLFPAWMTYYYKYDLNKFDSFSRNVFDLKLTDKESNAKMGITKLTEFFKKLKMPLSFKDLGIESPDIELLVNKLTENGTRIVGHKVKPMDQDVAREIFNLAKGE